MNAFLVDDEGLALKRLTTLLLDTARVKIVGAETDPVVALAKLNEMGADNIDILFVDVHMPEVDGFELLARLEFQPLTVFTTAYDQHALKAFEFCSIDYLLKPVSAASLERAIDKAERFSQSASTIDVKSVAVRLADMLRLGRSRYPLRIASKVGERVKFIEVRKITHFFAEDKLTFASTLEGNAVVDNTIIQLEKDLDPTKFVRIHRSTLLNVDYVDEVRSMFGGRLIVKLKDGKKTNVTVARDRVPALRRLLKF